MDSGEPPEQPRLSWFQPSSNMYSLPYGPSVVQFQPFVLQHGYSALRPVSMRASNISESQRWCDLDLSDEISREHAIGRLKRVYPYVVDVSRLIWKYVRYLIYMHVFILGCILHEYKHLLPFSLGNIEGWKDYYVFLFAGGNLI